MGPRPASGSYTGLTPTIIAILLLGILSTTVDSQCLVDDCWTKYNNALQGMTDGNHVYITCVALRTYNKCVRNMTRSCVGDIKFHSVQKVVEKRMKMNNCSMQGPVYEGGQKPFRAKAGHNDVCQFKGKQVYRHCGLFGDPHLRTFNDEFQTCKVKGAWPLVDNDYLTVQVTNDPVIPDGSATATSKLTIIIKRNYEGCGSDDFVMYQAQTDFLPSVFDNGRSSFGEDHSVQITEIEPGKHVEIYIRYMDTTMSVRQVGHYFTFAIKMPEEIVNKSRSTPYGLELCVRGCPRRERINYQEFLALKHSRLKLLSQKEDLPMSQDDAIWQCRASKVVDLYFDSCVFDLMTTGDTNFALMANKALQDVLRLYPQAGQNHKNRTDLSVYETLYGSKAAYRTPPNILIAFLVLISLLVTCHMQQR